MLEVKFQNAKELSEDVYKYAVIMAKYQGQWIFVRHESRETWEIPGGRREIGETIYQTAERELVEETGAIRYNLKPISPYSVVTNDAESHGYLFFAEVDDLGGRLEHEICEVVTFNDIPENLTYPLIQPHLYSKAIEYLDK